MVVHEHVFLVYIDIGEIEIDYLSCLFVQKDRRYLMCSQRLTVNMNKIS